MNRITTIGVVITLCVGCCVVAAYFSSYYHHLYVSARTDLEERVQSFEGRIQYLESHKPKDLIPSHGLAEISTTDHPASEFFGSHAETETNRYRLYVGKGYWIAPEFRIPAGSTNRQEFDIEVPSTNDAVVGAWLSHVEPYQALASFDEFRAYRPYNTNVIRLVAQPKPGASFKFRFTLVILHEKL